MLHQMYLYNPDFFHEQGLVLNENHFHQQYTTGSDFNQSARTELGPVQPPPG